MAKYGKWIGGGLGWAVGGPVGAIMGFMLGSLFDNTKVVTDFGKGATTGKRYHTQSGDFSLSMIILSAAVMKADERVLKSELNYVKRFFTQNFGPEKSKEMVRAMQEILKRDIPIREVCEQIRHYMQHPMRLQMVHYLFGIARADGHVHPKEVEIIRLISGYLGIRVQDFNSIKAMFYKTTDSAYQILEIDKSATATEVKKAYRKMAVKYHPDKVADLGEEFQKAAKEKFQKVQEAYERIKKERGIK